MILRQILCIVECSDVVFSIGSMAKSFRSPIGMEYVRRVTMVVYAPVPEDDRARSSNWPLSCISMGQVALPVISVASEAC
jgi:hypothetical protein